MNIFGVRGVPGTYLGEEGVRFSRLCLGKSKEDMQKRWGSEHRKATMFDLADAQRASCEASPLMPKHLGFFFFWELSFPIRCVLSGTIWSSWPSYPLAGPVTLSRESDSGEEEKQLENDWNPLWCPDIFSFIFLCGISEATQFLPLVRPVLQPYLAFLSYSFLGLSWLDPVFVGYNQRSPTDTSTRASGKDGKWEGF